MNKKYFLVTEILGTVGGMGAGGIIGAGLAGAPGAIAGGAIGGALGKRYLEDDQVKESENEPAEEAVKECNEGENCEDCAKD